MPACFMNSSTDLVATELPLKSVLESLKKKNVVDKLIIIDNLDLLIIMISTCHTVGFLLARGHLPFEEQKFGTRSPWI